MSLKGILPSMDISATGLSAMRRRMNAIASNIANSETTRTDEGGPYRRRKIVMSEGERPVGFPFLLQNSMGRLTQTNRAHLADASTLSPPDRTTLRGVNGELNVSQDDPILVYDPAHPDANADGYVAYPNINVIQEMVDLIVASRAYEANVTVMQTDKEMVKKALDI